MINGKNWSGLIYGTGSCINGIPSVIWRRKYAIKNIPIIPPISKIGVRSDATISWRFIEDIILKFLFSWKIQPLLYNQNMLFLSQTFSSYPFVFSLSIFFLLYVVGYVSFYMFFLRWVKREERALLDIFLKKVSKIPALIEVMRPFIVKEEAFNPLISVHTDTMISSTDSVYDILSHNARLQNEFLFLMKLSVHFPDLQKHEYFLYVRDFIIGYERNMRSRFIYMNHAITRWNTFIRIKNLTLIWYLLPGSKIAEIV
jgi:hypothetical protein